MSEPSKNQLIERLRARLITVPKPGTTPWETNYPITLTSSIGGDHKAGDDAGMQQVASVHFFGGANKPKLQEHIYAVEPLCEEAAEEIERLTRERDELAAAMDKSYATETYSIRLEIQRLRAALEMITKESFAHIMAYIAREALEEPKP